MPTITPRAVFVTRETDYELLLARHATREQARFSLKIRGQPSTRSRPRTRPLSRR